jgi:hypothetical protein
VEGGAKTLRFLEGYCDVVTTGLHLRRRERGGEERRGEERRGEERRGEERRGEERRGRERP